MEPESSLPCSQEPSTGPYPESDQSSPYHPNPSKIHFNIIHPPIYWSSFWLSHQRFWALQDEDEKEGSFCGWKRSQSKIRGNWMKSQVEEEKEYRKRKQKEWEEEKMNEEENNEKWKFKEEKIKNGIRKIYWKDRKGGAKENKRE
jgi:hypothetical protein